MRTIRTKIYKFEELTPEGQNKAIEQNSDINVDSKWWESVYEDAERINLKLTDFDLYQNNRVNGHFINDAYDCANKIIAEHGENCETFLLSTAFINKWDNAVSLHSDGINIEKVTEGQENYFDNYVEDYEEEFLKDILKAYANLLRQNFDYLQSEEAIKETLINNKYEFLINGKIYS